MPSEPVELFLILAHEDEVQLCALLRRLLPPGSLDKAIVHIDAKSRLWKETRGSFLNGFENVQLIKRPVPVYWAHASMVHATALLLEAAGSENFDLAHLLSGADWPTGDKEDRLRAWDGMSLIEAIPGVQSERMNRFWLAAPFVHAFTTGHYHWRLKSLADWFARHLPGRRAEPWGPWHKGSQWWSLTPHACRIVAEETQKALRSRRLVATLCADEHLIQTILAYHLPHAIIRENKRATRWEGDSSSPRILTAHDWPDIVASGAWFARKLSRHVDPFFLDL